MLFWFCCSTWVTLNFFVCVFADPNELELWEKSIRHLLHHFQDKYGLATLAKWNFETWNEPDHKIHMRFSKQSYRNYLKATWSAFNAMNAARRKKSKKLRFGGPAGSCRSPNFVEMCKTFLQFCKQVRMQSIHFVSFHRKGHAEVDSIVQDELEKTLPFLSKELNISTYASREISIFNDEADPLKAWWKPQLWRATVAYPALVARSIHYLVFKLKRERKQNHYLE